MEKVEFFDWNLSNLHPVSFLWSNYPKRLRPLRPRPDMHSALHLAWVRQGSRRGSFAHQQLDFSESDFYLTAPWEPHCTLSTSEDHRLLLLNIDLESLQNAFFTGSDRLQKLFTMVPAERMQHLNHCLRHTGTAEQLFNLVQQPESAQKELWLWNIVQKIFIDILPEKDDAAPPSGNYLRLLPALKALSGRMLSVDEAAELCNLSVSYFAVIFKQQFGLSFGRYERNYRLNGAAIAIRRGSTLKEAADEWGFCDKSHLARLLKGRQ